MREIGRFEPFAPLGDSQTLPDGDIAQIGVGWNHDRFPFGPDLDARTLIAPEESGLYYIQLKGLSGETFTFP
ncbi:MAG: carboxypeptidase regulatory-like domain-containing protein, partial [Actinobacteria bacterium]|nr:carboxypeptidase regulatory-like domain-containing protein [Actinomycetota bacterium]